jgi:type I restriction enzyme S subunit
MKLETFFEKFDQFADAPGAVATMRELVLELAATGRLVPEVLDRPVTEDTKLMGTLVELVMGQAPAGNECNTEGRGTVFVKVGEFGPLYPREEVWTTNPLKFAKTGDVLVCVVGATVGKLNLAIDCAIGRSAAAIRPSSAIDTKFLYYSLVPYTLRLRRNSRGSAQGVIGKVELNAVSLWVPSREVQKRIVAKVDELMALCDRLETQQQERETRHASLARASLARFADAPTPANLPFLFHPSYAIPPADLRKSILTLAVQGKLVHRVTSDGIGSDILKDAKVTEAPPDDVPELPEHWTWARLGNIVTRMDSGWSPACSELPQVW